MDKDKKHTVQRMTELMKPIERQIMMCDDRHDLLMMASAMMIAVKDIFDNEIGEEGRKKMFKELT
jgi:hypothetical protein